MTTIVDNSTRTYAYDKPTAESGSTSTGLRLMWVGLRLSIGFMLLWAFFDKLFGLGYGTPPERSWLNGGSPTRGFLDRTSGPAAEFFQALSGSLAVDVLFMAGLLLIGAALLLGIGIRIAGYSGALLFALMWVASMPGRNNPFLDQHVVYALVLLGMTLTSAGDTFGFGKAWARQPLVRRLPLLK